MKQFVYPAVLYLDQEENLYTVAFHDLDIYAEGETVEECFLKAQEILEAFFECVIEFDTEAEDPTEYLKVVGDNKSNIVLLVDAIINE